MSAIEALDLMARLTGLALAVDVLELLHVRGAWGPRGIWRAPLVARDLAVWPQPLARLTAAILQPGPFLVILGVRGACALLLLALGSGPWAAAGLLATVLVSIRWRGTFNGGSDQMMVVLLSALSAASLDPRLAPLSLAYVAAQVVLSYLVAGVVKLIEPTWRTGEVLHRLAQLPRYAMPARAARAMSAAPRVLAGSTLALECLSPLALLDRRAAVVLLGALLAFHLANAWALGLNRFLLTWAAGYPAVWWASGLSGR